MSEVDFKQCSFQLSCPTCFESINTVQQIVAVGITGAPIDAELKRMFIKPELNIPKCPCCGQDKLVQCYSYEAKEYFVVDDLPF
jgi:hypothetical protein